MAEKKPPAKPKAKTDRQETEYVVLQLVLLEPTTNIHEVYDVDAIGPGATQAIQHGMWLPVTNADAEVQLFNARNKSEAIRMVTGSAGEIREGTWKAVSKTAWAGVETTRRITAADRQLDKDAL